MRHEGMTEHFGKGAGGGLFYLQSGPQDGPPIIFVHGWPELALSWRHVLPCFGGLGFRAIAPDLRGFGRSTRFGRHEDYAQEHVVSDLVGLLDTLGIERALFVGHDWGSGTVWCVASHHPDRCVGVASLCVPYRTIERGFTSFLPLVDRDIYPEHLYPWGQWAYQRFYHERFERACSVFDANPFNAVKALFRRGSPEALGRPSGHVKVFDAGGWFGGLDAAPDMARDDAVLSEADLCAYTEALTRNGFFGPDSLYMNDAANLDYSDRSVNDGRLDMPVLFVAGRYDITCEFVDSRLADPMREFCSNLTETVVPSGHWMAQEKPTELNAVLTRWIAASLPCFWPRS